MKPLNQKGQGLVETLLCLPLVLSIVGAMALLSYRSIVFHFTHYHLHEALLCASDQTVSSCNEELRRRLKKVLIGRMEIDSSLRKNSRDLEGYVRIPLSPPLKVELRYAARP